MPRCDDALIHEHSYSSRLLPTYPSPFASVFWRLPLRSWSHGSAVSGSEVVSGRIYIVWRFLTAPYVVLASFGFFDFILPHSAPFMLLPLWHALCVVSFRIRSPSVGWVVSWSGTWAWFVADFVVH